MISRSFKSFMFIYLISFSYGHASQAGKAYNDADKELNTTYQKVINRIENPEEKKLIIEAQKAWVIFRDAEVAFHAKYYPASKGGLFVATDMTEKRVQELKILLTEESQHEHDAPFSE